MRKSIKLKSFLLLAIISMLSCKKNFENPNAATSDAVLNNAKALMGVAVGIQKTYSQSVHYGLVDATGLTTNETFLVNVGNASELQLTSGGGTVDNTNALLQSIWTTSSKCIYDANNVIQNASKISDKGYASGLIAYVSIIKALSIGAQSMYWENVPNVIGTPTTTFIPRFQGFTNAISALDDALATLAANPVSAGFIADLPAGIDLSNTIYALKARYYLFVGNYSASLSAANSVDLTKVSTFNFDAAVSNPIFQSVTSTNNIYQPIDSTLGLPIGIRPLLNDSRVPFYTTISASPRFRLNGFWNTALRKIPIYLSDEISLTKAECLLRQPSPDVTAAQTIIDAVLNQLPSIDVNGVGANISTGYVGASDVASLLTEVYRNRCIEMYLSGLKLEDMRRFGRPLTERKRNFFPYPINERNNNPNIPNDPIF